MKPASVATLTIETPLIKSVIEQTKLPTQAAINVKDETPIIKPSLGSLLSIRKKITQKNSEENNEVKVLEEEDLHTCWGLFIEKLREKNNFSAVTNFKAADLKVIDQNTIEIVTQGEIHRAFIEVERSNLITHLQEYFNNRFLVYQISLIEKEEEIEVGEVKLNRKQQYLKMIEEYPLVKELKDRLNLEIE